MTRRIVYLYVVGILLLLMPGQGQAAPKVEVLMLPAGHSGYIIQDKSLPFFTLAIRFKRTGSAYDPPDHQGLAYMAASLMTQGASDKNALQFHQELENKAIRLSVQSDEDHLTLLVQSLREFRADALRHAAEVITSPRFDEDAMARVRAEIIASLNALESDPDYVASRAWKEVMFSGHPYGRVRRGSPETLVSVTRELLQSYAARVRCAPALLAAAGDIDPQEIQTWANTLLSSPLCEAEALSVPAYPAQKHPLEMHVDKAVPQTVIMIGLPAVTRQDSRFYAAYVLNHMLGGDTLTSRLGERVRDKEGLAYYADSDLGQFEFASFLTIRSATKTKEVGRAVDSIQEELQRMVTGEITQGEFVRAKNFIMGSFPLHLDSQENLVAYLLQMQEERLGPSYLAERNRLIEAVTLPQIMELARILLSVPPVVISVGSEQPQTRNFRAH